MNNEAREQAIEQITKIVRKFHIGCNLPIECNTECDLCAAKALYDAGYRLIDPSKLTVLSDEEISQQSCYEFTDNEKRVFAILGRPVVGAQLAHTKKELGIGE